MHNWWVDCFMFTCIFRYSECLPWYGITWQSDCKLFVHRTMISKSFDGCYTKCYWNTVFPQESNANVWIVAHMSQWKSYPLTSYHAIFVLYLMTWWWTIYCLTLLFKMPCLFRTTVLLTFHTNMTGRSHSYVNSIRFELVSIFMKGSLVAKL